MDQSLRGKIYAIADRVAECSLYAMVLFIPVSIAFVESFVCLGLTAIIVKKTISPDFTFIKSRAHFFILLFYIFCGFSLLNSGPYMNKSVHALLFKMGQYILIFFMVQDTLNSPERIRNAVRIFLMVGAFTAIDGIMQYFSGWELLHGKQVILTQGNIRAITGPFVPHYNAFAAYLICVLNLFIAVVLGEGKSKFSAPLKSKVIYGGTLFTVFMLLGCLLLTSSRGGWVGFIVAGLLMLFLTRRWKFMLALVCFAILMAFLFPGIGERAAYTFTAHGDAARILIWKGDCAMIKAHPFLGFGIGTFMNHFPEFAKGLGFQYAHNCYLQIWAETGIFSLVSFIGFIGLLLWQGIKSFRISNNYTTLGLLCALFAFLVHSFFDVHFYSFKLVVLFWFLAGMLAAVIKNPPGEIL